MRWQGGFNYESVCEYWNGRHVFDEREQFQTLCECSEKKRVPCECGCGDRHAKLIDATKEEQQDHMIARLYLRLSALEHPPAITETAEVDAPTVQ